MKLNKNLYNQCRILWEQMCLQEQCLKKYNFLNKIVRSAKASTSFQPWLRHCQTSFNNDVFVFVLSGWEFACWDISKRRDAYHYTRSCSCNLLRFYLDCLPIDVGHLIIGKFDWSYSAKSYTTMYLRVSPVVDRLQRINNNDVKLYTPLELFR